MKYATKYMVVPYNKDHTEDLTGGAVSFEAPQDAQINNLDREMTSILTKKLRLDEKIKLYGQTLARFAAVYHPDTFSLPSVLAELSNKTSQVEKSLAAKSNDEKKLVEKIELLDVKLEKDRSQRKNTSVKQEVNRETNKEVNKEITSSKRSQPKKPPKRLENTIKHIDLNNLTETTRIRKKAEKYVAGESETAKKAQLDPKISTKSPDWTPDPALAPPPPPTKTGYISSSISKYLSF